MPVPVRINDGLWSNHVSCTLVDVVFLNLEECWRVSSPWFLLD